MTGVQTCALPICGGLSDLPSGPRAYGDRCASLHDGERVQQDRALSRPAIRNLSRMSVPTKAETDAIASKISTAEQVRDEEGQFTEKWVQVPATKIDATSETERHVLDGPFGCGFTDIFRINKGGVWYQKSVHHGPEPWREQDWTPLVDQSK